MRQILGAAGRMADRGQAGTVAALLAELETGDAQARSRAIARLGRTRTPQVAHALARALHDAEPFVRWSAAQVLGELASRAPDPAVPLAVGHAVLEAAESAQPGVRAAAADAIAAWGPRAPLEPVLNLAQDAEPSVRAAAVRALGLAGGPALQVVRPALARALEDPDFEVRRMAAHAVAWCHDTSAIPALRARLSDPVGLVRAAALRTLARVSITGEEEAALPLLADTDPTVRAEALRFLQQHGTLGALDALSELENDDTPVGETTLGALAVVARRQIVRRQGLWQELRSRWRAWRRRGSHSAGLRKAGYGSAHTGCDDETPDA